jgi:hypothetical protein
LTSLPSVHTLSTSPAWWNGRHIRLKSLTSGVFFRPNAFLQKPAKPVFMRVHGR